jgi:glutathione reductase (NADPH)
MAYDYDLIVIGAGSGGVRAARIAANHGARVAIAEEYRVGGTCVIRGCVPKKLLVYASRFADDFEDARGFGFSVGDVSFDWPTLIAAKDKEIDRLEAAYGANLERSKVEIIKSRATLEGPNTVRFHATNTTATAAKILIATGGAPNVDRGLPGVEHVITSNEVFHLQTCPKRVVIAGAGYIAVEFASIFAGLGSEVTVIYRGDEILRGFDGEVRQFVRAALEKRGVTFVLHDTFARIEKTADGLIGHTRAGRALMADQILFAIGRSPKTDGLGLETAGVIVGEKGEIKVDGFSRTNVPSIFAVGDVTDRVALTPVAIREGHAFADTEFGGKRVQVDHETIPTAVFTTPEIGTVGVTEEHARAFTERLDVYRASFRPMKNTLAGRDERMLMKLLVCGDTDRVLGCHIVGPDAAEMVQLVAIAMKMRATKADFDATMALHPSAAEELVTMRTPSARFVRGVAA